MQIFSLEIINKVDTLSVEELWTRFKSAIKTGIAKFVPKKKNRIKKSLPFFKKLYSHLKHSKKQDSQNVTTVVFFFKTVLYYFMQVWTSNLCAKIYIIPLHHFSQNDYFYCAKWPKIEC
jgi:hypothetical protein